eukprot:CAMPEP_0170584904 /NCGR_PEP_ID=MMETSP0224-20130122/8924_1 /TAXON_ID=285029 /ORGANISM="Togula jolla, Strain CCCM 725" /LENGTH=71 /DNA_ID=CAMNT_0010908343 /DNA_START=945 /DNA_END=1160 /DNA_ORIENTATION=-
MEAIATLEESQNAQQPQYRLRPLDESADDAHDQGSDAEACTTHGDDVFAMHVGQQWALGACHRPHALAGAP